MSFDVQAHLARLLTCREAADWLRISTRTLWSLTDSGEIPSVHIRRSVRYRMQDLVAYVERSTKGGGQ